LVFGVLRFGHEREGSEARGEEREEKLRKFRLLRIAKNIYINGKSKINNVE